MPRPDPGPNRPAAPERHHRVALDHLVEQADQVARIHRPVTVHDRHVLSVRGLDPRVEACWHGRQQGGQGGRFVLAGQD